jgi:hypothetical protein
LSLTRPATSFQANIKSAPHALHVYLPRSHQFLFLVMVFMLAIDVHNVGHPPLGPPCLPHFVAALAIVFILLGLVGAALRSPSCPLFEDKDRYPVALPRSSISTAWPFFCRRFDFLNAGFQSTGQSLFKFKLFKVGCFANGYFFVSHLQLCSIRSSPSLERRVGRLSSKPRRLISMRVSLCSPAP